jgi:hypothetical protein
LRVPGGATNVCASIRNLQGARAMADVAFVLVTVAFFALVVALAKGVAKL